MLKSKKKEFDKIKRMVDKTHASNVRSYATGIEPIYRVFFNVFWSLRVVAQDYGPYTATVIQNGQEVLEFDEKQSKALFLVAHEKYSALWDSKEASIRADFNVGLDKLVKELDT